MLSIARDITALRGTQTQPRHAQKTEFIGVRAGGVAHDFNTILTVIIGYTELLRLSLKGDEQRLRYIQEISDSVVRGAGLIRGLLTFSGRRTQLKRDDSHGIVANRRRRGRRTRRIMAHNRQKVAARRHRRKPSCITISFEGETDERNRT